MMEGIQEIKIGRITAKVHVFEGQKVLDVRRCGGGLIFVGFIGAGKWPFFRMVLDRLESALTGAGMLP